MSNDKKQKEEDKHKKLKQYAKENAEIAGIAGAGVLAAKNTLPLFTKTVGTITKIDRTSDQAKADMQKIHDAYKAKKIGKDIHLLTDPRTGNKVVSVLSKAEGDKYTGAETAQAKSFTHLGKNDEDHIAEQAHSFSVAKRKEVDELKQRLKNSKYKDIIDDPKLTGVIHHTGDTSMMLHEITHATHTGKHPLTHLPNNIVKPGITGLIPSAVYAASATKKSGESEKDYQKRMGRNIALASLGAYAVASPGQVIEEARANIGALRRMKDLGIKATTAQKKNLLKSWLGYNAMTGGPALVGGLGTYGAMKLLRRNKLKEEQGKLEKKSAFSDDEIIAGTETAKRELARAAAASLISTSLLAPAFASSIRNHRMHMKNPEIRNHKGIINEATKKLLVGSALGSGAVYLAPGSKSMKEYYKEKLEEAKSRKK